MRFEEGRSVQLSLVRAPKVLDRDLRDGGEEREAAGWPELCSPCGWSALTRPRLLPSVPRAISASGRRSLGA